MALLTEDVAHYGTKGRRVADHPSRPLMKSLIITTLENASLHYSCSAAPPANRFVASASKYHRQKPHKMKVRMYEIDLNKAKKQKQYGSGPVTALNTSIFTPVNKVVGNKTKKK